MSIVVFFAAFAAFAVYVSAPFDIELRTEDLLLSYWGLKEIVHTIMSFGFANGEQLAISIEAMKYLTDQYPSV